MGLLDVAGSLLQPPPPDPPVFFGHFPRLRLNWIDKTTGEAIFLQFDAVSQETHEALLTLTKHPVEDGADVVDNAHEEPRRITLEAYVSNKPLWSNPGVEKVMEFGSVPLNVPKVPVHLLPTPGSITRTITAGIDAALKPTPSKATVLRATGDMPDRAKAMWKLLKETQVARQLVKISTAIEDLENLMIVRLTVPRTIQDGNGATFQVELEQVRIVKSETVDAPVPAEARGASEISKGSKNAEKDKNAEKKKAALKSTFAGLFDSGAGALGITNPLPGP